MTLVLGPLLANGEVVDPNESMDIENTTEYKRYSPIIAREKKRRISSSNDTTTPTRDNGENNEADKGQDTEHKNPLKRSNTHDPQEQFNPLKPLRTSKSGSVC